MWVGSIPTAPANNHMKHNHYLQLAAIPDEFKEGFRVLVVSSRTKDGGKNAADRHKIREVSRGKEDFDKRCKRIIDEIDSGEDILRLYASVNPRDIEKAIRELKFNQLEADYYDDESRQGFYLDLRNRFVSCMAKPQCKAGSKFLIDCDTPEEYQDAISFCGKNDIKRYWIYPTQNGMHVITQPFNPNDAEGLEIKKDGMFLVHINQSPNCQS